VFYSNSIFKEIPGMSFEYLHKTTATYTVVNSQFLESPVFSKSITDTHVTLSWSQIGNATGYMLYATTMPYNPNNQVYSIDLGSNLSTSFDLPPGAHYISAIKAFNASTSSDFSNTQIIKIEDKPPALDIAGDWASAAEYSAEIKLIFDGVTQSQSLPSQTAPNQNIYIIQDGQNIELSFANGGNLKGTISESGDILLKGKAINESVFQQIEGISVSTNVNSNEQIFTGTFTGNTINLTGTTSLNIDMQTGTNVSESFMIINMNTILTKR